MRKATGLSLLLALLLLTTALAAAIRLPRLAERPMHTDEAVHAVKFATLIDEGQYVYDPCDYHGPTLNYFTLVAGWICGAQLDDLEDELEKAGTIKYYFTLVAGWIRGERTYEEIDERTLRLVPVAFGVLLVLLVAGIGDGLGWPGALAAALLTAISHAMVFYSRYYIQEILLVFFTFCLIISGWRYYRSRRLIWAILAGVSAAFMHATKETFVIALGAMVMAVAATVLMGGRGAIAGVARVRKINVLHLCIAALAALVVSSVLFSFYLQNPRAIIDSVATYKTYFDRAGHNSVHIHPWYYYLRIIGFYRVQGGPMWTEAFILLLAGAGLVAALLNRGLGSADRAFVRFIAFYAVILTVVYSLIPYKTPWCMLGFLHAWLLLAGAGAAALLRTASGRLARAMVMVLLVLGAGHLSWQAVRGTYRYYDHANPYVYGHTVRDIFSVVKTIEEMAELHPHGRNMYIEVICPGADYWPLPWYLRRYPNVGYYTDVDTSVGPAPVIVGYASLEKQIFNKIFAAPPGQYSTYVPLFEDYVELRPTVELTGMVMWDLKDGRLKAHAGAGDIK